MSENYLLGNTIQCGRVPLRSIVLVYYHCTNTFVEVFTILERGRERERERERERGGGTHRKIAILYFLVIRRISLISAYSLLSACYFVGLSTRY